MNLSKFLNLVDQECKTKTGEELAYFIHEQARDLDASGRENFLLALKSAGSVKTGKETAVHKSFEVKYQTISAELARIENEDLELDSEINEEYDDWYHPEEDEFIFTDPEGIGAIIENACCFLMDCIDGEEYEMGCELAENLLALEIPVGGEYQDCVGEPLHIEDLPEYGIANISFDRVLISTLHASYCAFPLKDRPGVLYQILSNYSSYKITLENIMQSGEELPQFEAFLKEWISYLGNLTGGLAQRLLTEAMELSNDEDALLENARRYVDQHPGLYEKYIQNQMKNAGLRGANAERLYAIGQEALDRINPKYTVRSRIALLMLRMAEKAGMESDRNMCMLEAFRSDSSAANYMRICLECADDPKREAEAARICRAIYLGSNISERTYYGKGTGELEENTVDAATAYMLAFFHKDFDFVLSHGMSKRQALGWSGTFMKCGLAAFLLLLMEMKTLQVGGRKMCEMVISHIGTLRYENGRKETGDVEDFWNKFSEWKKTAQLTTEQKEAYYNQMGKLIAKRVQGIMEANRRNYYGECAAYVAALGEAKESMGEQGGKQRVMEQYRVQYSRRSAFHQELRNYGMIKKK